MKFQGKRAYMINPVPGEVPQLEQGEYAKDFDGHWWARLPVDRPPTVYSLDNHEVEEHEDGTITVSPSIECEPFFHGYLKKGTWEW